MRTNTREWKVRRHRKHQSLINGSGRQPPSIGRCTKGRRWMHDASCAGFWRVVHSSFRAMFLTHRVSILNTSLDADVCRIIAVHPMTSLPQRGILQFWSSRPFVLRCAATKIGCSLALAPMQADLRCTPPASREWLATCSTSSAMQTPTNKRGGRLRSPRDHRDLNRLRTRSSRAHFPDVAAQSCGEYWASLFTNC
jgi:hypothetical protein